MMGLVDLSIQDSEGRTPLHLAAMLGHAGVVHLLLAAGGLNLLDKRSNEGKTAHDYATSCGHSHVERVLMELQENLTSQMRKKKDMWARAEEMGAAYRENQGDALLSVEDYTEIVNCLLMATSDSEPEQQENLVTNKFNGEPKDLICGEFQDAAHGLSRLLNVEEDEVVSNSLEGVEAIEEEVMALGDKNVALQLYYILWEEAKEKLFPNGVRDKGNTGKSLDYFVKHETATSAKLKDAEVVALRLYTTSAFSKINNPLRDQSRINDKVPHPLPVTVWLITSAIKKLRSIGSGNDVALTEKVLWRGLKDIKPTDRFTSVGGTEVCDCIYIYVSAYIHMFIYAKYWIWLSLRRYCGGV